MQMGLSVDEQAEGRLANPMVNVRILLAALWVSHFLLWTWGDMFTILQGMGEPVTETVYMIIAPTTAIVHALMVVVCLAGLPRFARPTNLIVAPLYLVLNVGFFFDATQGWEYYLGSFYVVFNLLIVWFAYRWPWGE